MRTSLEGKLAALLIATLIVAATLGAWLNQTLHSIGRAVAAVLLLCLLPALWVARQATQPLRSLMRALKGMVASYRDSDFSFSLALGGQDELGELVQIHNELGTALREQHHQLTQRELLLDMVTQQAPVALLLVDSHDRIVYSNLAARHLLGDGSSLQGMDFDAVLQRCPLAFREAVAAQQDNLFPVQGDGEEETYYLSQRRFLLRGRSHRLLLLKRLTRELSRQEVSIWKKLIRVLSHELNNSLGPISSLVKSGTELVKRGNIAELPSVLTTIAERADHLHEFISGYSTFARLPAPRPAPLDWAHLISELRAQASFEVSAPLPGEPGWADRIQAEQLLINLLKNARESGSEPHAIELCISHAEAEQRIVVRDRGSGMSEAVLAQALLPFYSTKRQGSGLGLALAREIAEAHGGRIRLANRDGGGLEVCVTLPLPSGSSSIAVSD
jgi:nitrogen fixation/metabolism regulation signal transduction histidine kinase